MVVATRSMYLEAMISVNYFFSLIALSIALDCISFTYAFNININNYNNKTFLVYLKVYPFILFLFLIIPLKVKIIKDMSLFTLRFWTVVSFIVFVSSAAFDLKLAHHLGVVPHIITVFVMFLFYISSLYIISCYPELRLKSSHIEALEMIASLNSAAYNIALFYGLIARINPFNINDPPLIYHNCFLVSTYITWALKLFISINAVSLSTLRIWIVVCSMAFMFGFYLQINLGFGMLDVFVSFIFLFRLLLFCTFLLGRFKFILFFALTRRNSIALFCLNGHILLVYTVQLCVVLCK